jgi:cell division protein FtsL
VIAPKLQPETTSQPRIRIRRRAQNSRFSLALTGVIVVSILGVAYTAACAVATSKGYSRAKINSQLTQVRTENQLLAAEVRRLESPDRLAALAQEKGMELKCQAAYLGQTKTTVAGKPIDSYIARNLEVNP